MEGDQEETEVVILNPSMILMLSPLVGESQRGGDERLRDWNILSIENQTGGYDFKTSILDQ